MRHMPGGISVSPLESQPCPSDKTDIDVAQALIDAVHRGDRLTVQRVLRRPDLPRIAVALAERLPRSTRPTAPCGTRSAAERHLRYGEPMDNACAEARLLYYRIRRRRQLDQQRADRQLGTPKPKTPPLVDHVVVERLINGQPPLHVTRAERAEAVRILHYERGRTRSEIGVQLHMSGARV